MARLRRPLFAVAAVLAGVVAAVLAGEAALRLFWPQRSAVTVGMFREDPDAGYALRPDYENSIRVPEYATSLRTDADGYRIPEHGAEPANGAVRVLALGDSFTFGVGVEAEEAWPEILEDLLNAGAAGSAAVRNGGVGGYGPLRSSRLFFARQAAWEPDVIIHAVYLGNDLEDARPKSFLRVPRIRDGRMVADEEDVITRTRFLLRIHSHLYAFVRERTWDLYQRTGLAEHSRYLDPVGLAEWPERIERESWPAAAEAIREMSHWANRNGKHYLVVLIPLKYQVLDGAWERYRARWRLPAESFDRWHAQRVVSGFLEREGIAWLDLVADLRAEDEAAKRELYFPADAHWTASGHRFAAERIGEELRRRGWAVPAGSGPVPVAAAPTPAAG